MKKAYLTAPFLALLLATLSGCDAIGAKSSSVAMVYGVTTALSLLLLIGYCALIRKKGVWFITLFASVFIVNAGYLSLSISATLEEALLANRIAYLGSAVLPLAMLMIIQNSCNIKFNKYFTSLLIIVSIIVFLIAASPGYLDIYYKSVELGSVNGATVLVKEYGSWHCVYLFYLLSYFSAMIATITYAIIKRRIQTAIHAVIIASAVFINIGVWLLEQLVKIDFEVLSVSYIITELFLLALHLMLQETEFIVSNSKNQTVKATDNTELDSTDEVCEDVSTHTKEAVLEEISPELNEKCEYFHKQLQTLTATEKCIYKMHIEKLSSKEIMVELNIKENTLKFHNKNLYSKLGVTSRKELREIAELISLKENM
ncbi:MAG: hypothetical protein IIX27_03950 [Ruminococcus sp.]|nr:hypothetical protein [Ruminococcus sp.]